LDSHENHVHRILTEIDGGRPLSQRSLAQDLGIALGLTNLLIRRLVRKGWVRVVRIRRNRVRYLLTPTGLAEKARMSRLFLQNSVRFYMTARDRIRESLASAGGPSTRVVFYGAGEVAEIAYVCLQATDLKLVAVIADNVGQRFFGLPVHSGDDVGDGVVGRIPFDRLIVTSLENREATRAQLEALGVAPERVHWL
jgi:DNA-binding MarR family transcriptional regulator